MSYSNLSFAKTVLDIFDGGSSVDKDSLKKYFNLIDIINSENESCFDEAKKLRNILNSRAKRFELNNYRLEKRVTSLKIDADIYLLEAIETVIDDAKEAVYDAKEAVDESAKSNDDSDIVDGLAVSAEWLPPIGFYR